MNRHSAREKLIAEHAPNPRIPRAAGYIQHLAMPHRRRRIEQHSTPALELEGHIEPRKRQPLDEPRDVPYLRRLTAHELAPRRHVEEQLPHFNGRPCRM